MSTRKIVPDPKLAKPAPEPEAPAEPAREPLGEAQVRDYVAGAHVREIARTYGWSYGSVWNHLRAAGVLRDRGAGRRGRSFKVS